MLRAALPAALLAAFALGGCRLVDQRTFQSDAAGPRGAQLARASLPPLPLAVIGFTVPDLDWRPAVRAAVQAAESRKPGVAFDVVAPIPTGVGQDAQDAAVAVAQADAQLVARELQSDGVPPERITLRLQGDPGAPGREVRLYAR